VILAVDAGNSRLKWALHDGERFTVADSLPVAALDPLAAAWQSLESPARIVVANVAGKPVQKILEDLFKRWGATPVWVAGRREQCGVKSLYQDPAQLGPDRWAALIGARHLCKGACLVVNAGTAMTVDALTANGEFPGGLIVPGFDLMHHALESNTARLSAARGSFAAFPRNSADAITSGAIDALCGAVERVRARMVKQGYGEPEILLGGGTAVLLAEHLGRPAQPVERLVLEGLVRIARDPA
jgi:type III pantothenate kinase